MLVGVRQRTQKLGERIEHLHATIMLLQGSKMPGILNGCSRLCRESLRESYIIDDPVIGAAFRGSDETYNAASSRQRQQRNSTNSQLLYQGRWQKGRGKDIINNHWLTTFPDERESFTLCEQRFQCVNAVRPQDILFRPDAQRYASFYLVKQAGSSNLKL